MGITRGRAPCHATYHYVFRSIRVEDLERALRGSQHQSSLGIHMLTAFSTRLQASIGSLAVPPDSAEMVEVIALLKDLPIGAGDVVTADAAFTYRTIVEAIRAKGADYFLVVKGNQPDLQAELAHAFGDDSTPSPAYRRTPEPPGCSTLPAPIGRSKTASSGSRMAPSLRTPARCARERPHSPWLTSATAPSTSSGNQAPSPSQLAKLSPQTPRPPSEPS